MANYHKRNSIRAVQWDPESAQSFKDIKKRSIFWKKIANGTVVDTSTVFPSRLSFPYRAGARFFGKTRCSGNNRNAVANLCERHRIVFVR